MKGTTMINFNKAVKLINQNTQTLPIVELPLIESLGFVLAEKIHTKTPIPAFKSSAVDGFAVNLKALKSASENNPVKLKIQGIIQAGDTNKYILKQNFTFKIFTGALVPENTDAIIMKEDVIEEDDYIIVNKVPEKKENIRAKGEEYPQGKLVFDKHTVITPPVISMLAFLGIGKVRVFNKPKVSIIVTGNELKDYQEKVKEGEIRDSNGPFLVTALKALGITPVFVKTIKDDKNLIKDVIQEATGISDIIITAGGVSVGDYDYVKEASAEVGFNEIYWKIAIKPGKPNYFAKNGNKLLFGLPGNPVAVAVAFYMLVRFAIFKMMGVKCVPTKYDSAPLLFALSKKVGRMEFVRGRYINYSDKNVYVEPIMKRESHMIGSIALANCLIHFPQNKSFLPRGSIVDVTNVDWFKIGY